MLDFHTRGTVAPVAVWVRSQEGHYSSYRQFPKIVILFRSNWIRYGKSLERKFNKCSEINWKLSQVGHISQQQFLMELFYPNTWSSILFSSIWHRFPLQAKKIQVHQGRDVLRFFLEAPSLQRGSALAQKRGAYLRFKFLSVISLINNC